MEEYYTQTSEYSPITKRQQDMSFHSDGQIHGVAPMGSQNIINPSRSGLPQTHVETQMPVQPDNINKLQEIQRMQQLQQLRKMQEMNKQYQYNDYVFNWDWREIFKRALKYLLEGLAVAFVAYYFTKGKLDFKEIVLLGITAAFVFAILDTFSPTVALGTRFGAGFGIGTTMFGLNPAVGAATVPMV